MRWSSAQRYRISNAEVNAKYWPVRGGQGGKIFMGKRLALLAIRLFVSVN